MPLAGVVTRFYRLAETTEVTSLTHAASIDPRSKIRNPATLTVDEYIQHGEAS